MGIQLSLSDYKTVAVTGASSGIGAAVAHTLSRHNLKVHAIARREDRLAEQTGCVIHVLDVRDTNALTALLGSLQVDVLVNNAGVSRGYGSLVDADPIDIDCTLDTNVRAAVHAVRAALPSMIERNTGHIVNIGSMAGLYPLSSALYGASKAALHVLSMDLRLELQGTGIRVTEICPGRVRTEFYDAALDDPADRQRAKESGIEELTSEDVAASVIYALNAPWRVNVNRIELQPTEQIYGGWQFLPRQNR
jgi:NADP-dependent 3-hydroxy acid dehydrogenase YdfG